MRFDEDELGVNRVYMVSIDRKAFMDADKMSGTQQVYKALDAAPNQEFPTQYK